MRAQAERERSATVRRNEELEAALARAAAEKDELRARCDAEKATLSQMFEQRIAALRVEKQQARGAARPPPPSPLLSSSLPPPRRQARLDKTLLRRLGKDLDELKTLSAGALTWAQHYPDPATPFEAAAAADDTPRDLARDEAAASWSVAASSRGARRAR